MNDKIKSYIAIAIVFMIVWGVFGLIEGEGFFGGIGMQIDAIGDIISGIIKAAIIFGVIWFIIELNNDNNEKENSNRK